MPRDIRSYFTVGAAAKAQPSATSSKPRKRRVISSDEDEEAIQSPVKRSKKTSAPGVEEEKEVKIVSPADIFGKRPIKRQEAPKLKRQSQNKESETHNDDDFEASLCQLDTSQIEEKYLAESKPNEESTNNKAKKLNVQETTPTKEGKRNSPAKKNDKDSSSEKKTSDKSNARPSNGDKKNHDHKKKLSHSSSNEEEQGGRSEQKDKSKTTKKASKTKIGMSKLEVEKKEIKKKGSPKKPDLDVYEERAEKKKQGSALYMQYLQRGGARNPGSKEIPVGADNCLAGLSFLITGVLDSLEREDADELIKKYGGRILHQVSRKTDYVIVGDQPGPSKLAKADSFNIKKISEDDLLEMIRSRPAGKAEQIKESRARSKEGVRKTSIDQESKSGPSTPKKLMISPKKDESPKSQSPVKEEHVTVKKEIITPSKTETFETKDAKIKAEIPRGLKPNEVIVTEDTQALVEKYRPKTMKQIVGQQGDKSNAKKLYNWLMNWHKNQSGNVKHAKPSPWAKNDDGAFFKAALLSGPPGIGKTTTVQVVCNELGFDLVEFNASDTRSKKLLQAEVSEILSNTTLKDFFADNKKKPSAKHVLLMDEVDGMAGNEDRGGLQELISLIKSTDVPIVCICNDRNNPKMRTLANYVFDLRFQKPRLEQIRGMMKSICFKEKIDISTEDLDRLIESTNQDIRQVINHLALFVGQSGHQEKTQKKHINKDLKLGPWDVLRKVFSAEEHKEMSIHDKSDLFFHDYSIAPLFVQENYLSVVPRAPKNELLERVAESAESLSLGDIVEKSIRSNGAWSLLPVQAFYSSVIPGSVMSGHMGGQINFPSWLGRNSKSNKFDRLMQEITVHARLTTGASKEAINLDYVTPLRDSIVRPLVLNGVDGVDTAINVMNHYHLLREDLDSLIELSLWPGQRDPMQAVESKVKAAFTRAYNKNSTAVPYAANATSKKKTAQTSQEEGFLEDGEEEVHSDENDDDVELDKMIKAKKPSTSKKAEPKSKSSDKPTKRGRGRGKPK